MSPAALLALVLVCLLAPFATGCVGLALGDVPYRCGEGDSCPDGYECQPSSDGERYCVLPGQDPPAGEGGAGGGGAGGGGAGAGGAGGGGAGGTAP